VTEEANSADRGFTLTELLVVVMIIFVLVGLVGAIISATHRTVRTQQALAQMEALSLALETYRNERGVFPSSTTNRADAVGNSALLYTALTNHNLQGIAYFPFAGKNMVVTVGGTNCVRDPFGNVINYYCVTPVPENQKNPASFDLWSDGPDARANTADDLCNWRR
jgi:prepilin-type N-terminal cleavage/methylation domain-containing protein